jgi:hypothetical protein
MAHVYGDSTAFPYDVDYIELSRHAVDCAVQLFSAQHAIAASLERAGALNQTRASELSRITAMSQAVESSLSPFLSSAGSETERIARRMLECVSGTAGAEVVLIERQAADDASHMKNIVTRSGESAHRALEGFLLRHDLPGTELGLTWAAAGEQSYSGQVSVKTPFGISAAFSLAIPPEHVWARARRLSELAPGLEVHFPQQSGWLSKRVEMAPVKLDRMYLSAVKLDTASAEFRLRKGATTGSGYRVLVNLNEEHQVVLQPLGEDGTPDADAPLTLDGEDSAQMFRLCSRVVESMQGLSNLRRSMVSAELDGQPLDEMTWPEGVAQRLIEQLAPVVTEIARRSGAPGELVLRRDVGGGRREEMYVTKAELYEKVLVLPPARRVAFEQLGLVDPLRAPPSSQPQPPPPPRAARAPSHFSADSALAQPLGPAE